MSDTNHSPSSPTLTSEESARLARHLTTLDELALPDEWYSAKGDTLAARFAAAAKAMRLKDAGAPSGPELMARYDNHGKPFVHSVWLNRPLFCPRCPQAGGDGFRTVMCVNRGSSVRITAGELHAVTTHGEAFPSDTLAMLKQVLNAP